MEISYDEALNNLLAKVLVLEAKVSVLESSMLSYVDIVKPGFAKEVSKHLKAGYETRYQKILLNHPWLKDDFDRLIDEAMPGD